MTCLFCDMIASPAKAAVVFEDSISLAFLDHRPLFPGHVLFIPRVHVESLTTMAPDLVGPLFVNAQKLCRAVQTATGSQGYFVGINNYVSQSVPHLHIHIVPRNRGDGLRGFFWPRTKYDSAEQMQSIANQIQAALEKV